MGKMKSRRELKALLLASVTALTLMSGCSKNEDANEQSDIEYSYYIEVDGEFIELDNVKDATSVVYGRTTIKLNDGTTFIIPSNNFYTFDKNSELQQELIKKLTN